MKKHLLISAAAVLISIFTLQTWAAEPPPTPPAAATPVATGAVPVGDGSCVSPEERQAEAARVAALDRDLAAILRSPHLKGAKVGILVSSLDRGGSVFESAPDALLMPASTMKIVTSAAALENLGSDYVYKTGLYGPAPDLRGVISGDVYLVGSGDPSLVSERVWLFCRYLAFREGITRITGDFVVDDSYFDELTFLPAWGNNLGSRSYVAPTGAASVNFNTIVVWVRPGFKVGAPAEVRIDPDLPFITLRNEARTAPQGTAPAVKVDRVNGADGKPAIVVSGSWPIDGGGNGFYRNVPTPALYTGQLFVKLLKEAGIEVTGRVRTGKKPEEGTILISEEDSKPFPLIIRDLNKYSTNFIAEQLLKTMGAVAEGPPGTTAKGVEVLKRFMTSLGFGEKDYAIYDGSGFSKQNRLTAREVVAALSQVYSKFRVRPEFVSSLGVMGVDGTVEDRGENGPAEGLARTKTGHLKEVCAISGYVRAADGEVLAFSFLVQDFPGSVLDIEALQDRFIERLSSFSRRG